MAAERFTFDTNILFYAIDTRDAAKHALARNLVGRASPHRTSLLLQALCELHNATSKQKPSMLAEAEAFTVKSLRLYKIIPTTVEDMGMASTLHKQHHLQFFDALLLAIAMRSGCTLFLSEDMQPDRTYGTLTVRNPFTMPSADLTALLA